TKTCFLGSVEGRACVDRRVRRQVHDTGVGLVVGVVDDLGACRTVLENSVVLVIDPVGDFGAEELFKPLLQVWEQELLSCARSAKVAIVRGVGLLKRKLTNRHWVRVEIINDRDVWK